MKRAYAAAAQPEFHYQDVFESTGELEHPYRLLTKDYVRYGFPMFLMTERMVERCDLNNLDDDKITR